MRILITGCCGFVGIRLLEFFKSSHASESDAVELYGIDNLCRPGSQRNRATAVKLCQRFLHGDLRLASDLENVPAVDWVIDASANASVLSGSANSTSSRQLIESNLITTINILEFCKSRRAGMVLLSSSRVYSIDQIRRLPLVDRGDHFALNSSTGLPNGCTPDGLTESFSTKCPISLYGATKLASEALALEYGNSFGFPVWINRCGLMAGAGQLGRIDQGIVAFWIHSWREHRKLAYIGYSGKGLQVRDCLHPADLGQLVSAQMEYSGTCHERVFNVGGGIKNQFSLAQLSQYCTGQFGPHVVDAVAETRPSDVPWLVLDSRPAQETFQWQPTYSVANIFDEIANHARYHPTWLDESTRE